MKDWSAPRLNQTAKTCLNHIQSFLQEKRIKVKTLEHHTYRVRVADQSYFQSYFERIGYPPHVAETLTDLTNALTIHKEKIIIVREKHIKDYSTILHELLHSLTWMKTRYKRWVREGLTRCIQKLITSHFNQETKESLYDELSYTKTWETITKIVGEKTLLLYFSENEEKALKTKTKKFKKTGINLPEWLKMNFNQAKSFLKK